MGGYQANHGSTSSFLGDSSSNSTVHGTISALSLQWLLFDFGGRAARVEAAEQASIASNVAFTAVHQQVIHDVTVAYYRYEAARSRALSAQQGSRTRTRSSRPPARGSSTASARSSNSHRRRRTAHRPTSRSCRPTARRATATSPRLRARHLAAVEANRRRAAEAAAAALARLVGRRDRVGCDRAPPRPAGRVRARKGQSREDQGRGSRVHAEDLPVRVDVVRERRHVHLRAARDRRPGCRPSI